MPRLKPATALTKLLKQMMAERQKHVDAIAEHSAQLDAIDKLFREAGVGVAAAAGPARRGPRAAVARVAGGRKKRGSFAVSGEESVLAFIKSAGTPSTAEVNAHWRTEGRGGKADNTLTKLVQAGKLKRVKSKDVRGSRYAIA